MRFKAAHAWLALAAALALGPVAFANILAAALPGSPAFPPIAIASDPTVGPEGEPDPFPSPPRCELTWRSETEAGWCKPGIEGRVCPDGRAWLVVRQLQPGGSCQIAAEFFPPCHPSAAWACSRATPPDGR